MDENNANLDFSGRINKLTLIKVLISIMLLFIFEFILQNCNTFDKKQKNIYEEPPLEQYKIIKDSGCKNDSETLMKILLNPYRLGRYRMKFKNSEEIINSISSNLKSKEVLEAHCKTNIIKENANADVSVILVLLPGESVVTNMGFKKEGKEWYFLGPLE